MHDLKRILIISNVPQTYRIPLFNEINHQLSEKNVEMKVVFASDGYKRRKSKIDFSEMKFPYQVLKSLKFHFGNMEKTMFTYSGISKVISSFSPDKIIVVGFSLATIRIFLRSFFIKTDYVIWSGAVELGSNKYSFLRQLMRRMLISRASSFVAYGSMAKEYLVNMGADRSKVYIGINTVDTKFFSNTTDKLRSGQAAVQPKHLLYTGYLVPRKNVGKVISIIEKLSHSRKDFILDILGDGPEREMLEKMVADKNLLALVKFHGFIQRNDLPQYYARSTCFLFQTDFDVWGLVLNEAMAAGLPVISSVNAGATHDLIVDGETGFALDYNNEESILEKINAFLDNPVYAGEVGKKARQKVEQSASIAISASGFVNCVMAH